MQKPLDPLSFKKNQYERPNQDWICGRAVEGRPCPLGPDRRGKCRATGQCTPSKKADRWFCNRSEVHGGKCDEGPLPNGECSHPIPPCQPVRSLRRFRGMAVWISIALTSGALLLLFSAGFRRTWMSPGELTAAHAFSAAQCSDCHSLDRKDHPPIAGFDFAKKRALADSGLCLNCHALGDHPLNPHGLAPNALAATNPKVKAANAAPRGPALLRVSRSFSGINSSTGEAACSTCHQEHHGHDFDLKHLSNAQCQTCHSVRFKSFENGHPEFASYPYTRRTRIFFDHSSHLQQHFTEMKDKAPGSCQDCHTSDPSGRLMQVKTFDATCAACHSSQIQGEGMSVKGVAFFTVPGIDLDTLTEKGISLGDWPKLADGKITPFMELLLNRQPGTRDAMQKLREVDLLDLRKATSDQIAAAEQLAWGVKSLLFNFVSAGQGYLLQEMKAEISPTGAAMAAGLVGQMSYAALLAAQKDWMPNLLTEVPNHRKGIKPPLAKRPKSAPNPSPAKPRQKAPASDQSLLGGEDLTGSPVPTVSPAKGAVPAADDDLLGGQNQATPSPAPATAHGSKSNDLTGSGDLLEPGPEKTKAATESTRAEPSAPPPTVSAEDWMMAGGWYRPPDSYTLFYRPSGHADAFIKAWLTVAAQLTRGPDQESARAVFRNLSDPQTPGVCMKCHTVDDTREAIAINWQPAHPEPHMHSFTNFNHTAHFSILGDKGCQKCHTLNPQADYAKYFTGDLRSQADRDPARFQSSFNSLSKQVCIQCHKPQIAGDSCLLCHQYHTGAFATEVAGGSYFQGLHPSE